MTDNYAKLAPDVPTLMEQLAGRGYRTAGFVSAFNFQPNRSDLPGRFEEFFPCEEHHERRSSAWR